MKDKGKLILRGKFRSYLIDRSIIANPDVALLNFLSTYQTSGEYHHSKSRLFDNHSSCLATDRSRVYQWNFNRVQD